MPPKAFLQWEPIHSQTSPCGQPRTYELYQGQG